MCSARRAARSGPTIYAIPKGAPNREAAYALIDYLLTPEVNAKEVAGARLSLDRLAHQRAAAQGDAGEPDPLSGEGASVDPRVRRGADADQPAAGRDHGALQGGLSIEPYRALPSPVSSGRASPGDLGTTHDRSVRAPGSSRRCLLAPAALFFFFLLILPLVVVVVYSFGERAPAGGYAPGLHLRQLSQPAGARQSLPQHADAGAARPRCSPRIVAYPMAYFLAVKVDPRRWRLLLLVLVHGAVLDEPAPALLCLDHDPRLARAFRPGSPRSASTDLRIINTPCGGADRRRLRLPAADGAADLCQPRKARQAPARSLRRSRRDAVAHASCR